jgi:Gas vesicle protein
VASFQSSQSATLVDVLDRILDKGLVVAGDVKISLANVELLTIRIRLLVCSIDKAEQIGLNWWQYDRSLLQPAVPDPPAPTAAPETETALQVLRLEARIAELERRLVEAGQPIGAGPPVGAPVITPDPPAPAGRTRRSGTQRRTR